MSMSFRQGRHQYIFITLLVLVCVFLVAHLLSWLPHIGAFHWRKASCNNAQETYFIEIRPSWNDDWCSDDQEFEMFRRRFIFFESLGKANLYPAVYPVPCGSRSLTSTSTIIQIKEYSSKPMPNTVRRIFTYTPATNELTCESSSLTLPP